MTRPLENRQIERICCTALRQGMPAAAKEFGISKQRVSQIFSCHKSRVLMAHELTDEDGNERDFKDLRRIFNEPL